LRVDSSNRKRTSGGASTRSSLMAQEVETYVLLFCALMFDDASCNNSSTGVPQAFRIPVPRCLRLRPRISDCRCTAFIFPRSKLHFYYDVRKIYVAFATRITSLDSESSEMELEPWNHQEPYTRPVQAPIAALPPPYECSTASASAARGSLWIATRTPPRPVST
jgi:hypothetical protein